MVMQRDILDVLWRFFSSRKLTLILLTAIAVVVSSSAIFPQIPGSVANGSSEYARWYAEIRAHYLQWTDLIENLGLFNIYGSIWLKIPLSLLILNLTICAVEQFEAASRWPNASAQEFDEAIKRASHSGTFIISGTVKRAVTDLRVLLEGHRYEVDIQEEEERSYLTAQRFSLARWGTLLAHGGLIVAVVGLLLGGRLAWREEEIPLSPGQAYQIQRAPSLDLRLDDFQVELYPDGTPRSYEAQLTLLEGEKEVGTGQVAPTAPFTYRGMTFYQRAHGPTITIRGLDAQGEPIPLQPLVPGGVLQDEATLQLSKEESDGYIAAPEENLILRLVFHPSLPTDTGEEMPALLVQAYRGGVTDIVFSETLFGSTSLQIAGNSYALEWGHHAILTIVWDPSFAPTLLGATSLLAAAIITLYLPPRYIWALVSGKGGVVQMRLAGLGEEDKGGGGREFDVLMREVEESL
jgi:cytochrome c biogenesis protein